MLVYRPRKFVIQFPRNYRHENCSYSDDTRYGYKKRLDRSPNMKVNVVSIMEIDDCSLDLVHLDCSIDE